jgi:DNA polymerase-3 subunit epsilon
MPFLKLEKPLVVFDLESTGVNPRFDRVIEFAAVKRQPGGGEESLRLLINPQRPIPPEATAIHGIRDADVRHAPAFAEVARGLLSFLAGCDLAGFGIVRFDVPLLTHEFERAGLRFSLEGVRLVDALTIFHRREPRNLAAALRFYCGRDLENAHSAEADARAALDVLECQLAKYDDLPRDVDGLHRFCNPVVEDGVDPDGKLRWRDGEVVIAFGQKNGMTLRQMAATEPGYLKWMLNKDFSPEVKKIARNALDGKFPQRPARTDTAAGPEPKPKS